jgi:hypothetical protein
MLICMKNGNLIISFELFLGHHLKNIQTFIIWPWSQILIQLNLVLNTLATYQTFKTHGVWPTHAT